MFFNIQNELVFTATINNALIPYLDGDTLVSSSMTLTAGVTQTSPTSSTTIDRTLLYWRMCHLGADHLEQLIKENLTEDLKINSESMLLHICEPCVEGKLHRASFPHTADCATKVLDQIFTNVHGPMQVRGHQSNCQWWGTFVNDAT